MACTIYMLRSQFTTISSVACTINMITTVIDDSIGINYNHRSIARVTHFSSCILTSSFLTVRSHYSTIIVWSRLYWVLFCAISNSMTLKIIALNLDFWNRACFYFLDCTAWKSYSEWWFPGTVQLNYHHIITGYHLISSQNVLCKQLLH